MSTLPTGFLFQFSFPCRKVDKLAPALRPLELGAEYEVPFQTRAARTAAFHKTANATVRPEPSGVDRSQGTFLFRIGWHESGLLLSMELRGKRERLNCDSTKVETSDGLRFCLDTRDVRDVHRATRFCHRFLFLPTGPGGKAEEVSASWLPIHRAKAHPNPVDVSQFRLASEIYSDGFAMSAFIPGVTLTGYEPQEHPRLGFHFTLSDAELGFFHLQHEVPLPVEEDPSLWPVLALTPSSQR
ncbi:MAG: hypothetical protein Q4G68_13380 [Planctomycetia bacterium]|nr:hypothetical protein [Planctomycetia bacterium]